jgi:hypothetical protein
MRLLPVCALALAVGCGEPASPPPRAADPAAPAEDCPAAALDAEALHRAYRDDAAAADRQYLGKLVQVSGAAGLGGPEADDFRLPLLTEFGDRIHFDVTCRFRPEASLKVRQVRRYDRVAVRGYCRGKQPVGGASPRWHVVLEECRRVE